MAHMVVAAAHPAITVETPMPTVILP